MLRKTLALALRILRELADEGAYERHLAVENAAHSGVEWRKFHQHRLRDRYARPKCC